MEPTNFYVVHRHKWYSDAWLICWWIWMSFVYDAWRPSWRTFFQNGEDSPKWMLMRMPSIMCRLHVHCRNNNVEERGFELARLSFGTFVFHIERDIHVHVYIYELCINLKCTLLPFVQTINQCKRYRLSIPFWGFPFKTIRNIPIRIVIVSYTFQWKLYSSPEIFLTWRQ